MRGSDRGRRDGKLLFPGFIDAHTHFDLDVCNTTTADNFDTGTRSAIRGGTTMVIDFACPNKGESLQYGLDLWHKKADGRSSCDYSFHMTIDDWNDEIKAEVPKMFEQGISSFKMYMTYPAMMIGDKDLFYALEEIKKYGGIAGVHCENAGVIDALIEQHKAEGKLAPGSHPECRPNATEAEAVAHLLRICEVADTPVVIVHLSTKEALAEVMAARARGQKVYVETCPHYLTLDESGYYEADFRKAAGYICAPPLRTKDDQNALWKGLYNGAIQTVSTDHCSFTLEQKEAGREDFTKIPGGLPGVETRGVLLYTFGVAAGKITKEKMAEVLSENPAKLYGAWPRKGAILAGSDADIVVYDPEADTTIRGEDMISEAKYTPYEGMRTRGSIAQVYLRGQACCRPWRGEDRRGRYVHPPHDRNAVRRIYKKRSLPGVPGGSFYGSDELSAERSGILRDHQLLVGRDDPDGDLGVGRGDDGFFAAESCSSRGRA